MSESSAPQEQQTIKPNDGSLETWVAKWNVNKIGFHRKCVSDLFNSHMIPKLMSSKKQRCVVFPLCGKTLDMKAVLDAGHQVIGIEGCQTGVEAFFNENNLAYQVEKDDDNQYQIYKGTDKPITIYLGDFFNFNKSLPTVDYIWDRGGLVAINPPDREKYRDCLLRMMTPDRTQLFFVSINYSSLTFVGPPFVVNDDEVNRLFGSECTSELLEAHDETEEYNSRNPVPMDFIEERLHVIVRKQK